MTDLPTSTQAFSDFLDSLTFSKNPVPTKAGKPLDYKGRAKQFQLEDLIYQRKKAIEDEKVATARAEERRTQATTGFTPFKESIKQQLASGIISYQDAQSQLDDYASKYDIGPQGGAKQELTDYYVNQVRPGQQTSQINAAYQEYLGAGPTEEQRKQAEERFQSGYYKSVGDLKDALKMSDTYQDKYNQSYLENYYQTMYGKAQKDEAGTKRYQFNLDPSLMPKYTSDLASRTGVEMPEAKSNFFGTAGEIEQNLGSLNDAKNFIYKSGLTNLQGQIDKEVQSLKNEGAKDISRIQQGTSLYGLISNAFT